MPKKTFFNLSEDKRQHIERIAMDEFAKFGYEQASINRIVIASGIAKGSFYQYFEDKGDLFERVMTVVGLMKMDYLSPVLQNPADHDFFTFLEELYRSGLAFAKNHPKAARISFEVYKNKSNPFFENIYRESRKQGMAFYVPLIDRAIERGEINPKIDKAFVIHLLIYLQVASFDYYLESFDEETTENMQWAGDIMPTVHLMIDFIKKGIGSTNQGAEEHD